MFPTSTSKSVYIMELLTRAHLESLLKVPSTSFYQQNN